MNVTKHIVGGELMLIPIDEKADTFPLPFNVRFKDSNLDTKDYGNLNIGDNPDTQIGMTFSEFQTILSTIEDYYVIGIEFSIDDDNKGSADNPLPELIVPTFN